MTCPRDLNHYSFGSILEWLFASVAGLRHTYEKPGFRRAVVAPLPNWDLRFVSCDHHASVGTWHVGWECIDENHLHYELTVPFGCEAEVTLPYATEKAYRALGGHILSAGTYAITYRTTRPLRRRSIIDWLS